MEKTKILIADDDKQIRQLLALYFEKEGFDVVEAADGTEALRFYEEHKPQLLLLDVMMPGQDGLEVCRRVRRVSEVPVILLTAKGEDEDRINGLDLGADDYITKPFNPREVVARVKAVLRRSQHTWREEESLQYDELDVNLAERSVRVAGVEVELTAKEMELLWYLAKHPGRVFSREQLLEAIWGYEYFGDTRTVDTHIKRLRQKITAGRTNGDWDIRTVWGVGYKFEVGV
ncbi:response regulator transcription factor [Anaeromusa sp.]|uniref:response regulator transcription factor n=1 Tax=Anaeromusa sp. TaxID=1872520 RepID=UPI0026357E63|nr:response regulator transcription factor [Anaeromusa sp.]MDD3157087.1 response regulator transcription factor [Anaeromusa sp.]NCB76752.1 response regulator transcription factor [Negativicutes bacterium]